MSNREIIEWLKKKAEAVPMPGARKMYEAAAKALEAAQPEHGTNLAEVGTDCISRQAAIDALKGCYCGGEDSCGEPWIYEDNAIKAVERLPPIQPKRGKWIDDGSELGCQCSQCGKTLDEYINCGTEYMTLTEIPKFCPNCGADMREVIE